MAGMKILLINVIVTIFMSSQLTGRQTCYSTRGSVKFAQ